MDIAAIDARLGWLKQLGVKGDRVRFVYARLPAVFTANKEHFQPQLEYLEGEELLVLSLIAAAGHGRM